MATVTRKGNIYTVTAEEGEVYRLDRPCKKIFVQGIVLEFPSIYGYPISFTSDIVDGCFSVEEYGEVANENYWESVEIPQT